MEYKPRRLCIEFDVSDLSLIDAERLNNDMKIEKFSSDSYKGKLGYIKKLELIGSN